LDIDPLLGVSFMQILFICSYLEPRGFSLKRCGLCRGSTGSGKEYASIDLNI